MRAEQGRPRVPNAPVKHSPAVALNALASLM
jgi:hypothetical protein